MENILKRLLDAELVAQDVVNRAKTEHDRLVLEAQAEVRRAEERFNNRIPEIQSSFTSKADERAQQTINEIERRYQERRKELYKIAEKQQARAVKAVVDFILQPQK